MDGKNPLLPLCRRGDEEGGEDDSGDGEALQPEDAWTPLRNGTTQPRDAAGGPSAVASWRNR